MHEHSIILSQNSLHYTFYLCLRWNDYVTILFLNIFIPFPGRLLNVYVGVYEEASQVTTKTTALTIFFSPGKVLAERITPFLSAEFNI